MEREPPRGIVAKALAGSRYRYGRRLKALDDFDEAADETLRRFIADWCEFWRACGYRPCCRAGHCSREGVPCFARDLARTNRILFKSQAFVDLYEAAAEVAGEIGDEEEYDDEEYDEEE